MKEYFEQWIQLLKRKATDDTDLESKFIYYFWVLKYLDLDKDVEIGC
jgi:hypothetical protein